MSVGICVCLYHFTAICALTKFPQITAVQILSSSHPNLHCLPHLPWRSTAEHTLILQRESKYLTFTMQWLYWGTVESKLTHWPQNNFFTSAVMKHRVFVLGPSVIVRPRSTGVVPFPAKHLSSEQERLQRSRQG